ncbi:MAG: putative NUDIX hydrolase [Parcubacteria group bacterium Gr01-1014_33]|nr:MAG: putative NUDIX hydrolase [Parcubacteria group bacterium Gr01-1014_33]
MDEIPESKKFINLGIVVNGKDEILMIRRAKVEKSGDDVLEWAFPGGKQRLNESRSECVRRKILARTGYDVDPVREISLRVHPRFLVMIAYHLCRLNSPKQIVEPQEVHEIAEIRWVAPEDVRTLITSDLDPKVAQEIDRLAKKRLQK